MSCYVGGQVRKRRSRLPFISLYPSAHDWWSSNWFSKHLPLLKIMESSKVHAKCFFFQTLAWNRTLDSSSVYDKVSAQPNTIVKQICFPNRNVLFLSLFSLFKNWMHNVGWGCAEILPSLQMFLSKIWHHLKNVFAIRFFDFVSLSFSFRRIEYSILCLTDLSLNCFLWRCENNEEIVLERAIKLVTRYVRVSLFIVHCRELAEFSTEVSNTWPRRAEETSSSVYQQRLVREGLVNSHISLTDKLMTRRNIKCIHK